MKVFIVMLSVALLAAPVLGSDAFVITDAGAPKCRIDIGADAPETVRFAARELQAYIRKMSGAELPIVTNATTGTAAIRLGPAARAKLPAGDLEGIGRDGYLITVRGGDLCIVGIDDSGPHTDIEALLARGETHSVPSWDFNRGTLYGVYRLLEQLGVRWFLPGDFGERVPDVKRVTFSGEIRENPHFISRMLSYWSIWRGNNFTKGLKTITIMPGERETIGFTPAENRMWELRMRGATFLIPLNHYPPRTRWSERFGEPHPEYFALLPDGTRCLAHGGHLCYTQPGVVDESVADIKAYIAGEASDARGISNIHPATGQALNTDNRGWPSETAYGNYFSLLPNDGFRACGCPNCAALTSTSGIQGEVHSRLVWDYIARCATRVPDANVTCLAYGSYSRPYPGMKKLPPNVVVGFCAFSHPASLYYKDTFDQYTNAVRSWAGLTAGNLAYWQHYLASNRGEATVGVPEHTPEMYARVVRVMAQYGNHAFCEMMADSIMFELFNRYMLLKLFYDPTLDEKEIFQDYIERFYGPDAGPLIGAIYADIEAKSIERFTNKYAAYSIWEKLFSEKTMRDYHAKVNLALEKAAGTPYERAVAAFRDFYLGLMERGRMRYANPLSLLLASFNPEFSCRVVRTPPTLDGVLDEAVWKNATPVALGNTVNGKATVYRTEVRSCHDATNLYIAVTARDPELATRPVQSGDPGTVDGIAIYLDVPRTYEGYYRVAVDLAGGVHDDRYIDHIQLGQPDWRSGAVANVTRADDGYVVEVAIPRAVLGVPEGDPSAVECGILVGRTQATPPRPEDRQSSSSLLLRGKFEQPNVFNALRFTDR